MSALLCSLAHSFKPTNLSASGSHLVRWSSTNYFSRPPSVLPSRNWQNGSAGTLAKVLLTKHEGLGEEEEELGERKPPRHQSENFAPVQPPTPEGWSAHRRALKAKFPDGWAPPRKLSRDAMEGLRSLHAHDPETFTTPVLAQKFHISPEAVRRVLRSKWQPTKEQRERMIIRERQHREEWIKEKRKEENKSLNEVWKARQEAQEERPRRQRRYDRSEPRGVNKGDRLSMR
ncbi:hypothetical protein BV25DRAFT_1877713 [Artomyces pyxidatus]|uniref:Uncharacterized protein n=1 Tax=Artomyces pyxidatus TaxID=48021 RepID=A0ACB8TEI8_9AGAM|nr:hypothetical protein BV25DRAFT_1877713 [Artomyces pyxidatus]